MALPYAPSEHYRPRESRIPELLMRQGEIAARRAERSGEIWSQAAQQVGGAVAGAVQQYGEQKAATRQGQALDAVFARPEGPDEASLVKVLGHDKGLKVWAGWRATHPQVSYEDEQKRIADAAAGVLAVSSDKREQAYQYAVQSLTKLGKIDPSQLPPSYDEDFVTQAAAYGSAPKGEPKLERVELLQDDGSTLVKFVDPRTAGELRSAPKAPEAKPDTRTPIQILNDPNTTPEQREAILANTRALEVAGRTPKAPSDGKGMWVTRGGAPVHIQESQIQPGDTPYESARTAVRKIPAGSAEDLAGMQTGLDELDTLTTALSGKEGTGTAARAGAALWDPITEVTGWGQSAKERQAKIDLTKQLIGKTLEGGVLRKEDEIKYAKVLPKIGDPPAVAASKLADLKVMITKKRERSIEALGDAGYDVEAFQARKPPPASGPVTIKGDEDFAALPSGAEFIAPDGSRRRKP